MTDVTLYMMIYLRCQALAETQGWGQPDQTTVFMVISAELEPRSQQLQLRIALQEGKVPKSWDFLTIFKPLDC